MFDKEKLPFLTWRQSGHYWQINMKHLFTGKDTISVFSVSQGLVQKH